MILLFMLATVAFAKLPPSVCDQPSISRQDKIEFTGPSNEMSSCTFTKKFKESAYIQMERSYAGNEKRYRHSRDSFMGIHIKTPEKKNNFDIEVHNDRIEIPGKSPKRCFGLFKTPHPFVLRINMYNFVDIQKTLFSIAYKRSKHFQECFTFETEEMSEYFQMSIEGESQTGMIQIVRNIDETDPQKSEAFAWDKVIKDVQELKKDVESIRFKLTRTRVEHLTNKKDLQDNHVELKESMDRLRVGHRDQLNRHSWTTYGLVGFLLVLGLIAIKRMKEYIRKRDKIF